MLSRSRTISYSSTMTVPRIQERTTLSTGAKMDHGASNVGEDMVVEGVALQDEDKVTPASVGGG